MNAAVALPLCALLSGLLPAQRENVPTADLNIAFAGRQVEFHLQGPGQNYLGAVLLSLESEQTHYFQGLPALLTNFAVLGVGMAKAGSELVFSVPESRLAPGVMFHAQGLTSDGANIQSTPVRHLVLDVTFPK